MSQYYAPTGPKTASAGGGNVVRNIRSTRVQSAALGAGILCLWGLRDESEGTKKREKTGWRTCQ
jgi:hypothetical protein